jgi:hypothetical protein
MTRTLRWITVGLLAVGSTSLVGCKGNNTLETGYEFTPLGASPAMRRAFYAGPFSAEAREAQIERGRDSSAGGPPVGRYRPGN